MKLIAPDYYPQFSCLMGACRHSCCAGWEIDIDAESLARYRAVPGEMGKRLAANIEETADGAHFRLTPDERCPFLNADGLCDMILALGENSICQICDDHPRFRNFFADRTEIGLGLCCEAAGRLILLREAPAVLTELASYGDDPADPDELALLELRASLIADMQDRTRPIDVRIESLLAPFGLSADSFDWNEWVPFLLSLERLDDAWADALTAAYAPCNTTEVADIALEQLAVYLLYRHLPGALEDDDARGRIIYAALITLLIRRLCCSGGSEEMVELARLYSSELEYSDENLWAILDRIAEM